ncbi:hypothetical protein BS47DRAFT_721099 [Hydnum rufescens UP504]|uniref:GTP cyclohydrolase II n=1 Tax=Hydnum rufescens UP504 TaxID=1448309 RepID=A0A9P6ADU0_9AGAM|nr:hypothetical protein BS47DRAFT_721099 [Hydnum rufescens UP504]
MSPTHVPGYLSSQITPKSPSIPPWPRPTELIVQCKARTRVPTPHGPVFLHIYHNNWDSKEHLVVVIDPAQLDENAPPQEFIRSRSLDARWHDEETDMDRIVRGAYVGRLSSTRAAPSRPHTPSSPSPLESSTSDILDSVPVPIVRIHSECFTGETIGSMRCDCGEQLDEAIRYISHPQPSPRTPERLVPGRGAVIYLRQEGRGIGLLEKIRAYNLQDMGYDTVAANLMLGHGADERGYEIAAAIMRDLGLDTEVRLLTNNPEKMEALRKEGIIVKERLPMVPRSWSDHANGTGRLGGGLRKPGATMIGGGAARGADLEKYLRTKVQRMGHLLELPTPAHPQPTHDIVLPTAPSAFVKMTLSPVSGLTPLPTRTQREP